MTAFPARKLVQDDQGLVAAALRREPQALTTLAERLECIPKFLFKIHGQRGERVPRDWLQDLSQTTFTVVLEKLSDYRAEACLETWVYRTCFFQYLAHEKVARRRRPLPVATETLDRHPGGFDDNGDVLDREQELTHLSEALAELPEPSRMLLERRHFENRGFPEIASELGVPVGTLKNRYYRILEELRRTLRAGKRTRS